MHSRRRAALLSLLWALLNAGIGALAFSPHQRKAQGAIFRSCPSASSTVALYLTLHKQRQHLVVRYAHDDGNYDAGDGESLLSQLPEEVFAQISGGRSIISFDDLTKWEELQEMLQDGEILISELQTFYDKTSIKGLDKAGFVALYKMIDDLFEETGDDDDDEENTVTSAAPVNREEDFLISFLTDGMTPKKDGRPCGIDCTNVERDVISDLVREVVAADSNRIAMIQAKDMIGVWELLYTSSKAMIMNGSLSGLTVMDNEIRFSGVRQTFTGSKFLGFVEFVETYTQDNEESFTVKITGEWMMQENSRTAESCALKIDPENMDYDATNASGMTDAAPVVSTGGGVSQVADWQSLGPIKRLDVIYATPDLYIGRGRTLAEVLFVWRKVKQ